MWIFSLEALPSQPLASSLHTALFPRGEWCPSTPSRPHISRSSSTPQGVSFVRYVETNRSLSLLGRSFDHHDVVDVSIVANGNKALLLAADRAGTVHLVGGWVGGCEPWTEEEWSSGPTGRPRLFPRPPRSQCEYNKQHPLSWGGDRLVPAGALHLGGPAPAPGGGVTRMQSVALDAAKRDGDTPGAHREALVVALASGRCGRLNGGMT